MSALVNLIQHKVQQGPWLEFGVAYGNSLRDLATVAPFIYGFDSWNGLPEDWRDDKGGLQEPRGTFCCDPPRHPPLNSALVIGRFEDTLPAFLKVNRGPFGFVHIDCDLYSSTKFVLNQLHDYLDNVIIAFDEIRGFPAGEHHEGRAFAEFLDKGRYSATLIGYQHNAGAVYRLCYV